MASHLKRHKLIHCGEKPFACSECKNSCTTAGSLNKTSSYTQGKKMFKIVSKCLQDQSHDMKLWSWDRISGSDSKIALAWIIQRLFNKICDFSENAIGYWGFSKYWCFELASAISNVILDFRTNSQLAIFFVGKIIKQYLVVTEPRVEPTTLPWEKWLVSWMCSHVDSKIASCHARVVALYTKKLFLSAVNPHVPFQLGRSVAWVATLVAIIAFLYIKYKQIEFEFETI